MESEQDLSGDEAHEELDRRQLGLGSDIDPSSASAVLQLQVCILSAIGCLDVLYRSSCSCS